MRSTLPQGKSPLISKPQKQLQTESATHCCKTFVLTQKLHMCVCCLPMIFYSFLLEEPVFTLFWQRDKISQSYTSFKKIKQASRLTNLIHGTKQIVLLFHAGSQMWKYICTCWSLAKMATSAIVFYTIAPVLL